MPNAIGQTAFPNALDDARSLLQAVNDLDTTLAAALTAGATSAGVTDAAGWPVAGVFSAENEIVAYDGVSGSTLQNLQRGFDGTAAEAHSQNVAVEQRVSAVFHNALRAAIVAIETKLGIGAAAPALDQFLAGSGVGSSIWRALSANDIPDLSATYLRRFAQMIGNGSATVFNLTHNFNTRRISVTLYRNSSPWETVDCDVERPDTNTARLIFAVAPSSDEFEAVIFG